MENDNINANEQSVQIPVYYPETIIKYDFTRRETALAFTAVILGFGFIKLILAPLSVYGRMGLGACVFLLGLTAYKTVFPARKEKLTLQRGIRTVLCAVFSLNVFISSNLLIQFLDAVFVVLVILYDNLAKTDGKYEKIRTLFPIDMLRAAFTLPFSNYGACFAAIKNAGAENKAGRNIKNALLGLAIALPSTIVVGFLLMNADYGFEKIIDSIFSDAVSKIFVFVFQLLISLPAAAYIFGLFRASCDGNCEGSDDERCMEAIRSAGFLPPLAGVFSALPVCCLYVIFFFSQTSYFLSSFISRLPDDIDSYSRYARQGFFELCMVSVINLAIIIAVNLFCKYRDDGERHISIRIITGVLSVFTLLLISTAVSKMVMYINVYGLTPLRVYTTWFMLLLAVVFVGIFLCQIKKRINTARLTVTAFTIMFAILSFCNVDGVIAGYNIDRYLNGTLENPGFSMLAELSSGAAPQIKRLEDSGLEESDKIMAQRIINDMGKTYGGDLRTAALFDILARLDAEK